MNAVRKQLNDRKTHISLPVNQSENSNIEREPVSKRSIRHV